MEIPHDGSRNMHTNSMRSTEGGSSKLRRKAQERPLDTFHSGLYSAVRRCADIFVANGTQIFYEKHKKRNPCQWAARIS